LMQEDKIAHYRETQIKTASQGKLVVILYDGLLRFLDLALENLPIKKFDVVNTNIIRAQDILSELSMALNMNAGEISKKLLSIYSFLNMKLIEGNVQKAQEPIQFVRKMVYELRESWNKIANKSSITPIREMKKEGGIDVAG
jgi:flagellar protein FliS